MLCLEDSRAPLGRVEEVFGQVRQPLYSLRYAGGGQLPEQATVGASVASVQRLTEFILPEQLYAKGCTQTGSPWIMLTASACTCAHSTSVWHGKSMRASCALKWL